MNVILINSGVPYNLQGEEVLTANYILNKEPYKKLEKHYMSCEKVEDLHLNTSKYRKCLVKKAVSDPKNIKLKPKTLGPDPKKQA